MSAKGRLVFLCASLLVGGATSACAFGQSAVPLEQAARDGKAELTITGIGGSTGDTILVIVRRKVPDVLRLTLTPGTVFKSVSGAVQNMAGASIKGERSGENSYRPAVEIVLTDDGKHSYVVEAYCLDFHKANPGSQDSFTLAALDPQAASILSAGQHKSASIGAIQAALWMAREGLSPAQVQARFPVTAQDIGVARSIIGEIAQGANQQLRRQPEAITASDTKPTIQPGDTVAVASEGAKLMAGDTVIAVLKAGTEVKVTKVAGKWIAVVVAVNGASTIGWVNISDLKRVPAQGGPKAGTVAPSAAPASARIPPIKLVTREVSLTEVKKGQHFLVSWDRRKVAYRGQFTDWVLEGDKFQRGTDFEDVRVCDGKSHIMRARKPCIEAGSPLFSPDSMHIAYCARRDNRQFVVFDDVEGGGYDAIAPDSLIFSPDGKRIGYAAKWQGKWLAVVDGVEGKQYDAIDESTPSFSPDGNRFAYAATRGAAQVVVVDGAEGKEYDGIGRCHLLFSPDGKRLAYSAALAGRRFVVVDGTEGSDYDGIARDSLVFSPDGKRMGYAAKRGNKWMIVVDGTEGKQYDGIIGASLVFNPASEHLAYVATRGNKWLVVLDGVEGKEYDGIEMGSLVLSPHGHRVAYTAQRGAKRVVVLNGVEKGTEYEAAVEPLFSPDGARLAFRAVKGGKQFLVLDGIEGRAYDVVALRSATFSPDARLIAYLAKDNRRTKTKDSWLPVVNGIEGSETRGTPVDARLAFDNGNAFHFLLVRDEKMFRVEVDIDESGNLAANTKLHDAAAAGDLAALKVALEKQPELLNAEGSARQTPLHFAAKKGQIGAARLLLDKGAAVNAKDQYAGTPLHWAALYGHKDFAELVLANGAAINAKDRKGWTPLHYAAWNGDKDLVELLLVRGADIHAQQAEGLTPLHEAAKNGKKETAEFLIGKGASTSIKDETGHTPLDYLERQPIRRGGTK